MADEILDIPDARGDWTRRPNEGRNREAARDREDIRRARLQVKARCWLLSETLPKIHGDRRAEKAKHDASRCETAATASCRARGRWSQTGSPGLLEP
jgi:hypothetical protein